MNTEGGEVEETTEDPRGQAREMLREMSENAGRILWIHAPVSLLEEVADDGLPGALARMAQRHRSTDIRLLVDDDLALKDRLPELVGTLKRLTTAVSVRVLEPDENAPLVMTVIADQSGWMQFTRSGSQRILRGETDHRGRTRRRAEEFEASWEAGRDSDELRRVHL